MRTLTTRHRKMFATFVACIAVGIAALAFAAILGDSSGPASGKVGHLTSVTVTAGPVPGAALMPGGTAPGAVQINNPNSTTLYVVAQADGGGEFIDTTTGQPFDATLQSKMSVDAHAITPGVPVPPNATTTLEFSPVWAMASDASLVGIGDHSFTKAVRFTLADTPGG